MIKARVARHKGRAFRAAPLSAHLAYLKREGVTRDGAKGILFDAASDHADDGAFAERCAHDRHHFRFIVSPEDAAEMTDLRAFTRDLARQMESDLGTRLDWVAIDHWNTDNPHIHLIVRGVDEHGGDLVIARDYISRGMRSRAEDLVTIELGPKPEHEVQRALETEITAERWTPIDAEIRLHTDDLGAIDLRPRAPGPLDPEIRRLMIARLQHLTKMGLAAQTHPGEWMLGLNAEPVLRELGQRGDIIKTMHRVLADRGEARGIADFAIDTAHGGPAIVGRLLDRGLHDELTGEAYALIDATDGRAHYVRFRGIEAFAHSPPIGGIVEVRRFGRPDEDHPTLILANCSDLDLPAQVSAPGATWLDHRLVAREPIPLAMGGFGRETRDAMIARAEFLADQGLARRAAGRIVLQRGLLETLRRRELDAAGVRLANEAGLPYRPTRPGDQVAGTYRRQLILSSGRFAMIDDGLGFQLVPWSREIERRLGQQISGLAREGGGIDWTLARKRGLSL